MGTASQHPKAATPTHPPTLAHPPPMQTLPTEVYHSREELEAMPVGELLALLRKSGAKPGPGGAPPLEKRELIDALMVSERGGGGVLGRGMSEFVRLVGGNARGTGREQRQGGELFRGGMVCILVAPHASPHMMPMDRPAAPARLQSGANSSSSSCSICCEDYAAGDVLRALPCGHRFHLECIDRWLLSSTDYSRPPACPMCNAELVAPPTAS